MIVFDIGAGDGKRAAEWLKTFKDCLVYAFECDPRQFIRLQETKNKLKPEEQKRFKIYQKAVWNFDGKTKLYVCNDISSSSLYPFNETSIREWKYPPGRHFFKTIEVIDVECVTLDTIIKQENINIIDFIRIDAQGASHNVLQGISNKSLGRTKEILAKSNLPVIEIYKGQINRDEIDKRLLKNHFLVSEHEFYSRNQEIWVRYVSDTWKRSMSGKIYGLK